MNRWRRRRRWQGVRTVLMVLAEVLVLVALVVPVGVALIVYWLSFGL